jgi:hypothetical protein
MGRGRRYLGLDVLTQSQAVDTNPEEGRPTNYHCKTFTA